MPSGRTATTSAAVCPYPELCGSGQAFILEAEGRSQAITSVYRAIREANPDQSLIAILQLDTLSKFAESDNTKIVVPLESAALLGAAQTLRSVLGAVPAD